jgi:DNA repair protein RadC
MTMDRTGGGAVDSAAPIRLKALKHQLPARTTPLTLAERPEDSRPGKNREKIIWQGAERLTELELLALVLGTGARGLPASLLAERLLLKSGLKGLSARKVLDLCAEPGLGPAKAAQLVACFEIGRRLYLADEDDLLIRGPEDVCSAVRDLRWARKEHFVTFYLDARNRVIARETVSIGCLNASIVHPREVFEPAVRHSAASVILVHNHPSGETDPSDDDLALTRRLAQVGELLGIGVTDHVIVGRKGFTSFRQAGFL